MSEWTHLQRRSGSSSSSGGGGGGSGSGGSSLGGVGGIFDQFVERRRTGSIKFDKYAVDRGVPASRLQYRDVIPLWIADMDFQVPGCITEALVARTQHPIYGYTAPDFAVKDAVRFYLSRAHGVSASDAQLVFLPGLVVALNVVARVFASRGQSVMTATPIYPPFLSCAGHQGTTCIAVPLANLSGRFTFDWEAMESAVAKASDQENPVGVFLLCNPHNPIGKMYEREELLQLVAFCKRHDIVIVADEIHCDLVLPPPQGPSGSSSSSPPQPPRHISLLALGDAWVADNSIALHAPSKTFNIAGLGASFAVIPSLQLRAAFKIAADGIMADISTFGFVAMRAAYEQDNVAEIADYSRELCAHLRANADLLHEWANCGVPSPEMVKFEHEHQATYL